MELRFYVDTETGQPHIYRHGLNETEVSDVLSAPLEDGAGAEGARVAIGRTEAGRFVKVIYVPDSTDVTFVITAYPLVPKAVWALRRRLRKRQ